MKLSVIIPVYNAAPYLEGCIQSVLDLKIEKEIIVVDDGSTDGGVEGLKFKDEGLGIKVIRQTNQGVSAARNAGLKEATGEWVWFVDADDWVTFETRNIAELEANFVVTGFVWEEGGVKTHYGASEEEIPYNLWRCWFRRELIEQQGLRFTVGRKYAEDQEFILKYLLAIGIRQTVALPELVYHYTVRPGSAITRKGMKGKQVCDILCVTATLWACALKQMRVPKWIWGQTKRLLKTAWVVKFKK